MSAILSASRVQPTEYSQVVVPYEAGACKMIIVMPSSWWAVSVSVVENERKRNTLSTSKFTFVDLFAGVGGFHAALSAMGGECLLAVEKDEEAARVYEDNWGMDPRGDVSIEGWMDSLELQPGALDVLAGGFPCFPAGTMVLTSEGYRAIEKIEVGDLVLTHKGRWRRVTTTMRREYRGPLQTIRAQGTTIQATDEHPFWARPRLGQVWDKEERKLVRGMAEPQWVNAEDITKEHYLSQPSVQGVEDSPMSEDFWWVAGRFLGDGWLTTGKPGKLRAVICCSKDEADDLEHRISKVVHATRSEERTVVKFHITQGWFVDEMLPFGRGALNKTVTRRELMLPQEKSEAFLQGYLSADGYIHKTGESASTVSRSLALGIAQMAYRARGVVCSIRRVEVEPTKVIEGRTVRQRPWYQVTIPNTNKSAFVDSGYGWKKVKHSESVESVIEVFNISVDEDETYCAEGAVVHNCQPFSKSGAQRGMDEARGTLFFRVCEAIERWKPAVVVLENVRNLTGPRHAHEWEVVTRSLYELGYEVSATPAILSPHRLAPSAGGTPQARDRVYILATRCDEPGKLRAPGQVEQTIQLKGSPGGWELDRDLPLEIDPPEDEIESLRPNSQETLWIEAWMVFVERCRASKVEIPRFPIWVDAWKGATPGAPAWKEAIERKNRSFYLENQELLDAWTDEFEVESFPGSRRKLEWQAQDAESLKDCLAQMRPSGLRVKKKTHAGALVAIDQRPFIVSESRRLSVRECARLQGFPEEFTFRAVPHRAAYKQLGNAVHVGSVTYALTTHLDHERTRELLAGHRLLAL